MLEENSNKVATTARQLGLKDKKTLRDWRHQKDEIVAEVRMRLKDHRRATQRCIIFGGGKRPSYEVFEVSIVTWYDAQQQVRSAKPADLWEEAAERLKALRKDAHMSPCWKVAFRRRYGIKFRSAKRLASLPVTEAMVRINGFLSYIHVRGSFHKAQEIVNTDECPLSFDGEITRYHPLFAWAMMVLSSLLWLRKMNQRGWRRTCL